MPINFNTTLTSGTVSVLSSPTSSNITDTSSQFGVSTDTTGGTLYGRLRAGGSEAAEATIKSDADITVTPTVNGVQGPFTLTGLTASTAYSVDWVHETGGGFSNVVTSTATTLASGSADFTLAAFKTSVLVGEIAHMTVASPSNFNVSDDYKEISWLWGYDDAGATYEHAVSWSNSANQDIGWRVQKYWDTSGTKTVTATGTSKSTAKAKTLNITVVDPDTVSWDRDIYVSFAGTTTGWPTETGAVEHITSQAEWDALSFSTGSQDVRITFRDDEEYTYTSNSQRKTFSGTSSRYYVTRDFAGTNPPKILARGSSGTSYEAFRTDNQNEPVLIVYGIDADCTYNPVTGEMTNGFFTLVTWTSPQSAGQTAQTSVVGCTTSGCNFILTNGGASSRGPSILGAVNCKASNWPDYAMGQFGGMCDGGATACDFEQNDLALLRDGKSGWPGDQGPDHTFRFGTLRQVAVHKCKVGSKNGWSPFGNDAAGVQSALRLLPAGHDNAWQAYVYENEFYSARQGMMLKDVNNSTFVQTAGVGVIEANRIYIGRQARNGMLIGVGGVTIMNNLFYYANLQHPNGGGPTAVFFSDGAGPSAVRSASSYVGFNTMVSDATVDNFNEFGSNWSGGSITREKQAFSILGHPNASNFADHTPMSRGQAFKPVTGSSAISAVQSGEFRPVRDLDGNLRGTGNTNLGAHHDTVASGASVSAPVYVSGLTIQELPINAGEYHVVDLGEWANGDGRFIEWDWRLNGVSVEREFKTTTIPSSGTLTCRITMTNLSGIRETATSNGISV